MNTRLVKMKAICSREFEMKKDKSPECMNSLQCSIEKYSVVVQVKVVLFTILFDGHRILIRIHLRKST